MLKIIEKTMKSILNYDTKLRTSHQSITNTKRSGLFASAMFFVSYFDCRTKEIHLRQSKEAKNGVYGKA